MNKGQLVELLNKYPDEMPVILMDNTTDVDEDTCYDISESDIFDAELDENNFDESGKKVSCICISFNNRLNPKPIRFDI